MKDVTREEFQPYIQEYQVLLSACNYDHETVDFNNTIISNPKLCAKFDFSWKTNSLLSENCFIRILSKILLYIKIKIDTYQWMIPHALAVLCVIYIVYTKIIIDAKFIGTDVKLFGVIQ